MTLLAHTLALLAMTAATVTITEVPLDMALDSFDDQYRGCTPAMASALPALYNFEYQKNPHFAWGWYHADAEWRKRGSPVFPLVSPWQAVALMAYTMKHLYKEFNAAVRVAGSSREEYQNNFHFKTLHFLLTDAVVTLKHVKNEQCHHVFRGVRDVQFKTQPGQSVRFGQFTSTSLSKEIAQKYGRDTLFVVYTCHGVDIQFFSYDPRNREVLIPPFETFKVTKVTQNGKKTRISLRSTGTYSKHSCAWLWGDDTVVILGPWGYPLWDQPQGPLPPGSTLPGHHSPGSGHWNSLSHEATKVTEVTVVTVAAVVTTITKTPCNKATTATVTTVTTKAIAVPHWPLWPLFSMAHTLALLAMTVATAAIMELPLDIAQDSFDDQYLNCGPAMTEALLALNSFEFLGLCNGQN
ncbi:LOW QUALITY PROTEIN: NAD(P)(+)--arginine ADP-ribosyltransferase 2-like [Serinus canaria]|uniref:LOW QUALITY PROTEIN: NAD(P)(+)--arginine ADP-ribosyltransferase 2-like n=1 Tax=Serinus canaria TaxID=9135 RepID=UPI0021CC9693|nr:LOW QUALITY PROTEIN: NAD(P)(+)--arginine ADP-ribosyltransferase 2-like [Serinus canaria]